jgi:enamine deaminase RidA (YjgF/YER057c/UK114 family)
MGKTVFNPKGVFVPRGSYTQVAVAKPGRLVFIAGTTASDPEGNLVGVGDAAAQARYVFTKIKLCVEAAGGTVEDIVSMTCFITDVRYYAAANDARREVFGAVDLPASTMVQVAGLSRPEWLIEINATAVVPEASLKENHRKPA